MAATDQQDRKPRVLVADGDCLVAAGIRKLLEQDCEVVGIVEDAGHSWRKRRSYGQTFVSQKVSSPCSTVWMWPTVWLR